MKNNPSLEVLLREALDSPSSYAPGEPALYSFSYPPDSDVYTPQALRRFANRTGVLYTEIPRPNELKGRGRASKNAAVAIAKSLFPYAYVPERVALYTAIKTLTELLTSAKTAKSKLLILDRADHFSTPGLNKPLYADFYSFLISLKQQSQTKTTILVAGYSPTLNSLIEHESNLMVRVRRLDVASIT